MTDILDRAARSRVMSRIRGRDTAPERAVRSHLHRSGLRFKLHVGALPGRPDIVLPRHGAVVQVNGCFWHRHPGCRYATTPGTNAEFWSSKFDANVRRDRRTARQLRRLGWEVLVVWECQVADQGRMTELVRRIRGGRRPALRPRNSVLRKPSKQGRHR